MTKNLIVTILGYWQDPYLKSMISWNPAKDRHNRKSPEIHLGYFTRHTQVYV